jgi:hypothetical protein
LRNSRTFSAPISVISIIGFAPVWGSNTFQSIAPPGGARDGP